jgi:hypothetical protein
MNSSVSPFLIESDHEKLKAIRSPTPKPLLNEPIHSRDEAVNHEHSTDAYVEDMKKGTSNIMVLIIG